MLDNMDILGVILAAAIAGIGSGIGVAIGNAIYKALLEEKVNAFLDKRHREEALKKIKSVDLRLDERFRRNGSASVVVDNMLGRKRETFGSPDIPKKEHTEPPAFGSPDIPRRFL